MLADTHGMSGLTTALRRYRNAEQLKGVMEQRAQTMQLDFTDDLKQGLGARLSKETVG